MKWRRFVYDVIEPSDGENRISTIYDYVMIAVIIASLVPLAFKESNNVFNVIDIVATAVFIADYLLRLLTADLKAHKGALSFLKYPFTPMAIVDLVSILPTFLPLSAGFRLLKIFRLMRSFRVFRAVKMFRYSKSVTIIMNVLKKQRAPMMAVCSLAVAYVVLSALVIFNVEPDTFGNFFDAIYWATVSLTTMGYGDIYPVSTAGRIVTMISSFMGIAIIALPAGIITAGYMDELGKLNSSEDDGE
ncbi:MAG: ion transporter [Clostridiales bacterium]|nr:ion transporter [Clostridiales bacterium]